MQTPPKGADRLPRRVFERRPSLLKGSLSSWVDFECGSVVQKDRTAPTRKDDSCARRRRSCSDATGSDVVSWALQVRPTSFISFSTTKFRVDRMPTNIVLTVDFPHLAIARNNRTAASVSTSEAIEKKACTGAWNQGTSFYPLQNSSGLRSTTFSSEYCPVSGSGAIP